MVHQIEVDVLRTTPSSLFEQPTARALFERMLFSFHILHPGSGYVQGMNDLFVPFFGVFLSAHCVGDFEDCVLADIDPAKLAEVEADTYWCATILLDEIQDYFTADRRGLQVQVQALQDLMGRIDPALNLHLEKHGVSYLQFAFR